MSKLDEEVRGFLNAQIDSISNVGIERVIISSIFNDPELIYEVVEQLSVEDFSNTINKNIVKIMFEIEDQYKQEGVKYISPEIIIAWSIKMGVDIGGEQYLKLISETKMNEDQNIKFYIKELKNLSTYRKSAKVGLNVVEESLSVKNVDGDTFISKQEEKFSNIINSSKGFDNLVNVADNIDEILYKRTLNPRDLAGIPTGFKDFDFQVGGLIPGSLTCVSAFTKTGKSALLTNWSINVAYELGIPVLYIDTEMSDEEFFDRVLSIVVAKQKVIIPEMAITTGKYATNDNFFAAVEEAKNIMKNRHLYHIYLPEFTLEKVINISRRFKRKYGVKWEDYNNMCLVVFDYIKLPDDSDLKASQEYQQLGYFTSGLKNKLAGREKIPVLTASQLNRSGARAEENDPSQLGGSLRILQFANTLCYLRNKGVNELENDGSWEVGGNQVLTLAEDSTRKGGQYKGWIRNYKPKGVVYMEEIRNIAF